MWRLLIVAVIALIPLAASQIASQTGLRVGIADWLPGMERAPAMVGERPPPGWQERGYLAANPDVATAVRTGIYESGYEHFRLAGLREGRTGGFPAVRAAAPSTPAVAPAVAEVPAER